MGGNALILNQIGIWSKLRVPWAARRVAMQIELDTSAKMRIIRTLA
jgi:hypothetical protein